MPKKRTRLKELKDLQYDAASRANSYKAWTYPEGSAAHKKAMKGFKAQDKTFESVNASIETELLLIKMRNKKKKKSK